MKRCSSTVSSPAEGGVATGGPAGVPPASRDVCSQARDALQRRDLGAAEGLLKQCVTANPTLLGPVLDLCGVYQAQGRGEELFRTASEGIKRFPAERRFYLTNDYEMQVHSVQGEVFFEVSMSDAWVWDMYRPARFVNSAKVLTFRDVSIEEIAHSDLEVPKPS